MTDQLDSDASGGNYRAILGGCGQMSMYSDGTDWVIAESLERANEVRIDAYGQDSVDYLDVLELVPADTRITVSGEELAEFPEEHHGDAEQTGPYKWRLTLTAAQWCATAKNGPEILCSTEW